MRKLYKLITDTRIKKFPNWIEKDEKIYTNQAAIDIALNSGEWHEMTESEIPEYNQETQYLEARYRENGNNIEKYYVVNNIEEATV